MIEHCIMRNKRNDNYGKIVSGNKIRQRYMVQLYTKKKKRWKE